MTGPNTRRNPYVGPRPFGKNDSLPARRRDVRGLCDLLLSERIVLLHSPSGAGKTSLVEADNGLRAALRQEEMILRPSVRVNQAAPAGVPAANRYVLSVLRSLEEDRPEAERLPIARLAELQLAEYLDSRKVLVTSEGADAGARAEAAREVLIFDQFEEILTADPTDIAGRAEFFRQASEALEARHRWVVFVIREDHLGALEPWFRRLPTHMAHRYRLDLLGKDGAREAIVLPAAAQRVSFAAVAVERLVDDLRRVLVQNAEGKLEPQLGPWIEPVQLQVVCFRLWEQLTSEDDTIDLREVEVLGDVNVALGAYYSERIAAVEQRTAVSQRRLRVWVSSHLLSPQGFRTQVMRGQGATEGLENQALDALEDAHLVRAQQRQGQRWYELAHDRLVAPVREDNDRWERENLHAVQVQAALWAREGKPESLLLSQAALAGAETWAGVRGEVDLEEPERSFLAASRRALAAERALRQAEADALKAAHELAETRTRAAIRQRRFTWGIGGLGVLASVTAGVSIWLYLAAERARDAAVVAEGAAERARGEAMAQTREARDAKRRAEEQRELALDQTVRVRDQARMFAVSEAAGDPTLQAVLLREVERPERTRGWLDAVFSGARTPKAWAVLRGDENAVTSIPASFSPDGRHVVTGADRTAWVWPADGRGEPVALHGHEEQIVSATFSPDGGRLVTTSWDGTARVWSTDGREKPIVLRGHTAYLDWLRGPITVVLSAAFLSSDRLVTTSMDDTTRVWSADGRGESLVLPGSFDLVGSVSPDGSRVVTILADRTARVWWSDGRGELAVLRGHKGPVQSASFSPDGTRVVTASDDNTARVWWSDGRGELAVLRGHTGPVVSAVFSPDSGRVVTVAKDNTARVWSANGRGRPVVLEHEVEVLSASFSPGSDRVLTVADDNTARVWPSGGREKPLVFEHKAGIRSASFSPDGSQLATASNDQTACLWSLDGRRPPMSLRGHQDAVISASFSPDGGRVVTVSDGTALLWSTTPRGPLIELPGPDAFIRSTSFSADGSHIVTVDWDGSARVWSADGRGESTVLKGHGRAINSAVFSPVSDIIVTASSDRTARLWQADGHADPLVLRGHDGQVVSAEFSPDGGRVVTASDDSTARVWAADGSGEPVVLRGHTSVLHSASFSPDGTRVVTSSLDATARVWAANGREEPLELRGHTDSVISALFSPDGTKVVTASRDDTARVWPVDRPGIEPIVLRGHNGPVNAASFSPDGHRVLTASDDHTARVWPADGQGEPVVLRGHDYSVDSAMFSPKGDRVVTASDDGTARVWSLDGSTEPVVIRHEGSVRSASFSPDGARVLVGLSGDAVIWPLEPVEWRAALWRATSYCLSVKDRVARLSETPEEAAVRRADCVATVDEYAAQEANGPGQR